MRMNEAPDVQVEIISVGREPRSIGEIGHVPGRRGDSATLYFQANGERYYPGAQKATSSRTE